MINKLLLYFIVIHLTASFTFAQNGETRVAKWKDDKDAAFSLNFDDSLPTQLENAVPNLESRGLTGTFYVNPGRSRHQDDNEVWLGLLNRGQHLAPHTMNHMGATSYEMAYYEIGAAAEYCWDAYGVPYHSKLLAYASGGGVTWTGLTREERLWIDDHFNQINRYHEYHPDAEHWHSDRMPYSEQGRDPLADLIEHFDDNWAANDWEAILYHGVGGNSSVNLQEFIQLMDYIESKKDFVWIGAYIDVFKYDMERFSAEVQILENTEDLIKLRLSSDISASGFITNDVNLYDEPLTLITQVPWEEVTVTQGSSVNTYTASNGELMYEALPNVGTINQGDIFLQEAGGLPVELKSFSASIENGSINLRWETATEVNNYGFEVEKQVGNRNSSLANWEMIGFVNGHGNSNSPKYYSFVDDNVAVGKYSYRLKQIDHDGTIEYSNVIEVNILIPFKNSLNRNYPNPFNPTTTIQYAISKTQNVSLKVYDVLGSEIATLVKEVKPAGSYEAEFDASELTGGIYFYRLQAGDFVETKKMVLMK